MIQKYPIILASNSPRRKQLLEMIGLEFEVIPSSVDEDLTLPLRPQEFVQHYSKEKASDVEKDHPDTLTIGADTVVVLDDQIIGKPKDENDSFNMLRSLSGRTHSVYTGVSILIQKIGIEETFFSKTDVTFNDLTDSDISYYIETYSPFDKAGSYGIQDWFAVCVNRIDGCFYNVMGFPLSAFYQRFKNISS
mgnify:CR=1 FL=1